MRDRTSRLRLALLWLAALLCVTSHTLCTAAPLHIAVLVVGSGYPDSVVQLPDDYLPLNASEASPGLFCCEPQEERQDVRVINLCVVARVEVAYYGMQLWKSRVTQLVSRPAPSLSFHPPDFL